MTGADFVKHYESHDEEELMRVEQFHMDLSNTLKHFIADEKAQYKRMHLTFKVNDLTLANFIKWLEEKGDQ
jgi:hypothetical protein